MLKGISSGLNIIGTGTLKWMILNNNGDEITIHLHNSLYVPDALMCLLSPQHMAQQSTSDSDGFNSKGQYGILYFAGFQHTIHYNSSNNLLILFSASDYSSNSTSPISSNTDPHSTLFLSSTEVPFETSSNLSPSQQKLLNLHYKMGHLYMSQIQKFACDGHFGNHTSISTYDAPLCNACLHGKQHRRTLPSTSTAGILDALHLEPGDCVSGDQVESTAPGLLPTYRGTPSTDRYHAGTLFVDHASRYLHFTPHLSTGSKEALQAKHSFELLAFQHNHSIKCYHTDLGIFASNDFCLSYTQQKQRMKFCGVNAHHQNGIAERHICSITECARTMLIHTMISWPDIITEQLWSYTLCLAVDLHNTTPGPSGLTPEEIFTGLKNCNRFSEFHPFGCPIFILNPSFQQGNKVPRWKPRSQVGIYLGFSPNHAFSIPLVLSTTTGLVSPQFHVVFNDHFPTMDCLKTNKLPTHWSTLLTTSTSKLVDNDFNSTKFVDASWFADSSHSTVSTDASTISSPSQRELHSSSLSSQREISSSAPQNQGWNLTHRYETRFREKFTAHTCIFDTTSNTTPFDADFYSAYIAIQDSYLIHSSTDISFLEHYACAAQSNLMFYILVP